MVRDVTDLFEAYRECARHVRNTAFSTRESKDWDTVDSFNEVADLLFRRLVLDRLSGMSWDPALPQAIEQNRLLIVPATDRVPVMISRDKNGGGYWDHPVQYLEPDMAVIAYREYFDWDQHALVDFRYYRGVVLGSVRHPEIAEHQVLIETIYGRVEFVELEAA
jgi:hypothetical protein